MKKLPTIHLRHLSPLPESEAYMCALQAYSLSQSPENAQEAAEASFRKREAGLQTTAP